MFFYIIPKILEVTRNQGFSEFYFLAEQKPDTVPYLEALSVMMALKLKDLDKETC
jgi:hypothetical protein